MKESSTMVPVISGINPNHGPAAGGTAVTISGSGFTGATSVKFATVPVSSFTLVSDSPRSTAASRSQRANPRTRAEPSRSAAAA
ncbi:IPT/TIG domain-containing protein [Kitasatospora sp. NPDC101155]|uniref:IPT/TIG domain-containing protein n=1 Tax=Kitasatospora sp. NPDC101155 TaxID=3364097 RepID=UPI00381F4C1A